MVVVINGNSGDDKKDKTPWGFGRKISGGTTLKKTHATRAYREEERHRSSNRWIPFKFPERSTTVISVEVAREINHRRFGDRDFEMSNSIDIENPEIAMCDFAIQS
jgi:hypothetical protein